MKKNKKNAIILMSGGLDCSCALASTINDYNYVLALTFDYGQKPFEKEFVAASRLAKFYNIKHKVIKLDWLKEITSTSLVSDKMIPENINIESNVQTKESAKNVWIPNRNSVFINTAAAILDADDGGVIVIGANKEEAKTFPDNSYEFICALNKTLEYSCLKKVEVVAPLINYDKTQIVSMALKNNLPFEFINSCYSDGQGHCGKCESCLRLKRALIENNQIELAEKLLN